MNRRNLITGMKTVFGLVLLVSTGAWTDPPSPCGAANAEEARLRDALERIALLDEADGHELTWETASQAVGIASQTLGKHPSQIFEERDARRRAAAKHKM